LVVLQTVNQQIKTLGANVYEVYSHWKNTNEILLRGWFFISFSNYVMVNSLFYFPLSATFYYIP
jgi:hypothetical protein